MCVCVYAYIMYDAYVYRASIYIYAYMCRPLGDLDLNTCGHSHIDYIMQTHTHTLTYTLIAMLIGSGLIQSIKSEVVVSSVTCVALLSVMAIKRGVTGGPPPTLNSFPSS